MWKKSLAQITPEAWAKTKHKPVGEIQRWWEKKILFDQEDVTPIIIIILNEVSDDDDDYYDFILCNDSD